MKDLYPHPANPAISKVRLERFMRKLRIDKETGCWIWTAAANKLGYGNFHLPELSGSSRTVIKAHRAVWLIFRGPIPEGLGVCHHCDIPACCNPNHLFLGTHAENMRDAASKGRNGAQRQPEIRNGERNPAAKLTPSQVDEIRDLYAAGGISQPQLARRFGVGQSQINRILLRQSWSS